MILVLFLLLAAGCSTGDVQCGKGTHLEGDTCVADDGDTGAEADTDTDTDIYTEQRVIGWFVEWGVYDRDYHVADIPAHALTHINGAFIDVTADGECQPYDAWAALEKDGGNYAQLMELREAYPDLRVMMSLGGWTLSSNFSDVAMTEASRASFVSSCVDLMLTYDFDGIDVDWEYPVEGGLTTGRPEDTENFTLLMVRSPAFASTTPDLTHY